MEQLAGLLGHLGYQVHLKQYVVGNQFTNLYILVTLSKDVYRKKNLKWSLHCHRFNVCLAIWPPVQYFEMQLSKFHTFFNYLKVPIGDCKTCLHLSSTKYLQFQMEEIWLHFAQKQNAL